MTQTTNTDITLAVVVSKLDDIREDIQDLKRSTITRAEYDERNRYIDTRLQHKTNETQRLEQRISAKTAPWWSVGALILSTAAIGWTVLGPAITGGN